MSIDSYKCRPTVISVDRQLFFSTVVSVDVQLLTVNGQLLTVQEKNKAVLLMALTSHRMKGMHSTLSQFSQITSRCRQLIFLLKCYRHCQYQRIQDGDEKLCIDVRADFLLQAPPVSPVFLTGSFKAVPSPREFRKNQTL